MYHLHHFWSVLQSIHSCTALERSHHRISIRLRSGLSLGQNLDSFLFQPRWCRPAATFGIFCTRPMTQFQSLAVREMTSHLSLVCGGVHSPLSDYQAAQVHQSSHFHYRAWQCVWGVAARMLAWFSANTMLDIRIKQLHLSLICPRDTAPEVLWFLFRCSFVILSCASVFFWGSFSRQLLPNNLFHVCQLKILTWACGFFILYFYEHYTVWPWGKLAEMSASVKIYNGIEFSTRE